MTPGQLKPAGEAEDRRHRICPASGSTATRAHLRRQGLALRQCRRAVECLPGARPPAERQGPGSLPAAREARRHLEVRREQARAERRTTARVRHRPAPDAGHRLARRRALHRDEQPRSARHLLARQVHGRRTTPSVPPSRSIARVQGSNFGWPYCFFDYGQKKFLLNPEYGGDGKTVGRCAKFTPPVAAFPAHWAPVDVMFYTGTQFPAKYQRRRVHRVPRIVEPRADAAGRLQRHVPAVRERQAVRQFRGVRRRLHRARRR